MWDAELHRVEGELLRQQDGGNAARADVCFHTALQLAQRQKSKSLELRAAMSLARLWRNQERRTEAHDLLAPVYGWFTEGFETADLRAAKALLDELR